jgi:hypothetical protein
MRPDQIARLKDIEERLADLFIDEADPDGWPEDTTERYKRKRAATETAHLLVKTQALQVAPEPDKDPARIDRVNEQRMQAAAAAAEAAVTKALKKAKQGAG